MRLDDERLGSQAVFLHIPILFLPREVTPGGTQFSPLKFKVY